MLTSLWKKALGPAYLLWISGLSVTVNAVFSPAARMYVPCLRKAKKKPANFGHSRPVRKTKLLFVKKTRNPVEENQGAPIRDDLDRHVAGKRSSPLFKGSPYKATAFKGSLFAHGRLILLAPKGSPPA